MAGLLNRLSILKKKSCGLANPVKERRAVFLLSSSESNRKFWTERDENKKERQRIKVLWRMAYIHTSTHQSLFFATYLLNYLIVYKTLFIEKES
jgi:hypothetical protein